MLINLFFVSVESYVKSLDRPDLLDLLVRPSSEDVEMEDVEDHRPSKRKIIYAEVLFLFYLVICSRSFG
jgi:hypothetical protein